MSVDERSSRLEIYPEGLRRIPPEVPEALRDLNRVTAIGHAAINLEHQAYQLRQVLRRSGEYDRGWQMYTVFEAPDLHLLVLQQPDEQLYDLERIHPDGGVDYAILPYAPAREKEYKEALALDISGRPVFIGDSIKTDGQGTGLWVYDEQRHIRAAFNSRSMISLHSEEYISHQLHPKSET